MIKVLEIPNFKNTYFFINREIIKKFGNPYICGQDFENILLVTAKDLINHIYQNKNENILVIRILEGGKYYYAYEALKSRKDSNIKIFDINIKSRMYYSPREIVTKVIDPGSTKMNLIDINRIIIGDTIASGSTMITLLKLIEENLHYDLIFDIYGFITYHGVNRIIKWMENRGYRYRFFSYGGLLGLGKNKTDMTLGDKPNYIPEDIIRYSISKLTEDIALNLCVIGDFTYSIKHIDRFIAERITQLWEVGSKSSNPKTISKARYLIREGFFRLMNMGMNLKTIENLIKREYNRRLLLYGIHSSLKEINLENILMLKEIS